MVICAMRKPLTKEKRLEYQHRYYEKHPEKKKDRARWNREWIAANRTRYNKAKSEYRFKLKLAVLIKYAGGEPACKLCGYNADLDALCLDHIENNGAAHRKELGIGCRNSTSGTTIYERVKALGDIPGLQVLCYNCNAIKELQRKRGCTSSEIRRIVESGPTRWRK